MVSTAGIVVTAIGAILAVTGALICFFAFPEILRIEIEKAVRLEEGTDAYERWETLRIPVVFKYYFFNVTNPNDVQKGAKPIVNEIGPYIYNQYRKKVDITRKDDILSYYQYQRYEFDEEASAPLKETDAITIVNLPLMSIATVAEENAGMSYYQLELLDSSIPSLFENPSSIFLTTTPKAFLFEGVDIMCNSLSLVNAIICSIIEQYAPVMMPRLSDGRFRFSLFGHKNVTREDYYSINSGLTDISQLGEIVAWGNSSTVNTWTKDSTCSKIHGSDAGIFPPSRTKESILHHFNTDICRSISVEFSGNISFSGVDGYRYIVPGSNFASPANNSENKCYCLHRTEGIKGEDGCLLDGVVELWNCLRVPALLSLPHFYLANEVYQNGVDGLKPNESLHTIYLDLEPMTGVVLRGSKRAQVNIFIRPIDGVTLTTNLPTTLMPVLWIDESFQLDDEYVDILNTKLLDVLDVFLLVKWSTITCGMIMFTSGLIWVMRSWNRIEHTKLVS